MESAGETRLLGASGFLKVVDGSFWDAEEDEAEGQIKPKSSPLPRRRGSESSDDSEPEPPSARPRKVRFADAVGLSLVSVKEFDSRDVSGPPGTDALDGGARDTEEYFLSSLFAVPSSAEELLQRLGEQKCELECVELLPGTTALRGTVRVLNLSFDKAVYVRTSLDGWCTHFDLLAEFVPGSSDGETDRFMFKLTLVPPFGEEGAKVEFCLRYETSGATFWANNSGMNYVLFCHQRAVRDGRDRQHEGNNHKHKKSCLKVNSKDSSLESSAKVTPLDTPGTPTQTQETVVRKPVENHAPRSEVPREDDRQKSPVDSNHDSSWRSRRRGARLARIRNRFYLKDAEAQEEGVPGQGDDTRCAEIMSGISSSPYWATTSNLPGVPDRNETNGTEQPSTRDQIPWLTLQSDRDSAFPFRPDTNGAWDRANSDTRCLNLREPDAAPDRPNDRPVGRRKLWDTLADVGDAHTARHTTELEEGALSDFVDSTAYPVETFAMRSDFTDRPPITHGNLESSRVRPVSEGRASAGEQGRTETTDLWNCREGAEGRDITPGDTVEDQTSGKRADEHKMARHRLWTDGENIWPPLPSGDHLESLDDALESAPGDLLKADTSTAGHKGRNHSQGGDAVDSSRSPSHQETRDLIADKGIEHDAQRVRCHGGRGEGNLFTVEFAELTSSLGEADTVKEAAVTLDSLRPEAANGMSLECDDSFAGSAMDIRADRSAHEPVSSCATFRRTFRGKGGSIREENSEGVIFGERGDKKDKNSVENVKDLHDNESGVSAANENVPFQNEEVSAEETAGNSEENNEDVLEERQNLSKDDMSKVNSENLYDEEETLMDYEEGLYDNEEILMGNEEDHYYEEALFIENEDLYGEEEMPMDNEVSILGLEEKELSVDRDLDYEVEMILGGLDKAFDEGEEGPEIGKRQAFREMEADLGKKGKEEESANNIHHHGEGRALGSKKEVDIREEDKEPWEEGEDLSLKMNKSVNKEGKEGAPSTESLPVEETDPHMSRVRYAQRQGLKPKTATGISQTMPRSGSESPSFRIQRMLLSSTNEPTKGYSETRDDPTSPQADPNLSEEPGYRTTANLPPVEKVETVARNDLSRWRDLLSHNISKTALYALVCVVFFMTAFQYDFLSCFAFYLITVYWLYIHREKKRLQDGIDQVEDNKR